MPVPPPEMAGLGAEAGRDYPIGFVRWTEQRNFTAVLDLMASGALDPRPLLTHRFAFDAAPAAFDIVRTGAGLGVLLEYPARAPGDVAATCTIRLAPPAVSSGPAAAIAGVIGAGEFARARFIPSIRAAGFRLHTIVSAAGANAAAAGAQFGFGRAGADPADIFDDPEIDTVFVATRHDTHADLALRALRAEKHVFVEKPLALTATELDELEQALAAAPGRLMVGFNRRFAPHTRVLLRELAGRTGPLSLVITVNAGAVPPGHWTQDPRQGGGRIAGEACHFIDLARALAGAPITDASCLVARRPDGVRQDDVAHLGLGFADGSTAIVHYLASGSPAHPKERIEAYVDGRIYRIDDWRKLHRFAGRARRLGRANRQDKGHAAELAAWYETVRRGAPAPIPAAEIFEVSRWTVRLAAMVRGDGDPANRQSSNGEPNDR